MTIVVVTPETSWIRPYATKFVDWLQSDSEVGLFGRHEDAPDADIAYYLGYDRIVPADHLVRHGNNLVVHESALPHGRGMSPMTWQVLEGQRDIPVTLFEAVEDLDAGPVYLSRTIATTGQELLPELRAILGHLTIELCTEFYERYPNIVSEGRPQEGTPSYYPRRRPSDSELDPSMSIADQFDLLRVVDNDRYPAFFDLRGRRYRLRIEPMDEPK